MISGIMGKKLDLSKLTDEEAKHVWEVILRDFDLRKKEEDRLGVLKMGSLDWYHEHVRSRFKRFGSAKVMRSLYKRFHSEQRLKSELAGSHDDNTYSMPDVRDMYDMPEEDEVTIDASEAQRYRLHSGEGEGVTRKESMIAEADIASVYQQILQEQGQVGGKEEQEFSTEEHLRINSCRKSLEKSYKSDDSHFSEHRLIRVRSSPKGSPTGQLKGLQRSQYYADMDGSGEEEEGVPRFSLYQSHFSKRRSRASSQENLHHSKPQISELNNRMSAIERLLNHLEQKIVVPSEEGVQSDADLEEKKLKKKLGELAGNISDKGLSSEEDEGRKKKLQREAVMGSSSDDLPNEAQKRSDVALCDITTEAGRPFNATERVLTELVPPKPKERHQLQGTDVTRADEAYRELEEHVYMAASKTYTLEKKLKDLEESAKSRYSGTTDSELSELEDKVASAAAAVQNTESEVSDIENRIAALSAAGLTVVQERNRRKFSGQTVATQQLVRRKLSTSHLNQSEADEFDRNALYRGSLTQRTPALRGKRNASYAKPIMAQHP
ncbi:rab effector MyRIP-like isoform X2 [Polyodon spathula]|uniref:rab effector MyRIP-like isoform X2 n=1 Tax=Polyodon spathula TaxID=7913 RepID=UPI001B7F0726|nr:rab effector MyRIP-like isoform X2 [Polyodon spathula]